MVVMKLMAPRIDEAVDRVDRAGVRLVFERPPHLHGFSGSEFPYAERHVVARRIDIAIVVHDRQHIFFMAVNHTQDSARIKVPDDHSPVARSGDADVVVDEDKVLDVVAMTLQHAYPVPLLQIPDVDGKVGRSGGSPRAGRIDGDSVGKVIVVAEQRDRARIEIEVGYRAIIGGRNGGVRSGNWGHAGDRSPMTDKEIVVRFFHSC